MSSTIVMARNAAIAILVNRGGVSPLDIDRVRHMADIAEAAEQSAYHAKVNFELVLREYLEPRPLPPEPADPDPGNNWEDLDRWGAQEIEEREG